MQPAVSSSIRAHFLIFLASHSMGMVTDHSSHHLFQLSRSLSHYVNQPINQPYIPCLINSSRLVTRSDNHSYGAITLTLHSKLSFTVSALTVGVLVTVSVKQAVRSVRLSEALPAYGVTIFTLHSKLSSPVSFDRWCSCYCQRQAGCQIFTGVRITP